MASARTTLRVTTSWSPQQVEMSSHQGGICTVRCENAWYLSAESPEELLRFARALEAFALSAAEEKEIFARSLPPPVSSASSASSASSQDLGTSSEDVPTLDLT